MHTFFHGWRRKAGIIMLLMACAVTSLWFRSLCIFDFISFTTDQSQHQIVSADGMIYRKVGDLGQIPQRSSGWTQCEPSKYPNPAKVKFIQLYLLREHNKVVSYWSLVLSLTLLSAYLIVWKPRRRSSPITILPDNFDKGLQRISPGDKSALVRLREGANG